MSVLNLSLVLSKLIIQSDLEKDTITLSEESPTLSTTRTHIVDDNYKLRIAKEPMSDIMGPNDLVPSLMVFDTLSSISAP